MASGYQPGHGHAYCRTPGHRPRSRRAPGRCGGCGRPPEEDVRGGLDELRSRLVGAGVGKLLWYEVPKSRKAPKRVRAALDSGAELVLVWGGDGMVQR